MRKGKFFCSFELFLGRSYITKECEVSVRNKVKEADVRGQLKNKSKKSKISLHQDSEVIQKKGEIKRKKAKLKPKPESNSSNPTEGKKNSKCPSGNCDKRGKTRELSGESPRGQHRQRGSDLLCPCPGRPV